MRRIQQCAAKRQNGHLKPQFGRNRLTVAAEGLSKKLCPSGSGMQLLFNHVFRDIPSPVESN